MLSSSSLYSTFISTVDHLPCDIVRSLWLVQTCNLALEKEKQSLHHMLQKHTAKVAAEGQIASADTVAHAYYAKQRQITRWHREAVAELDSLCNQLEVHEKAVKDQITQLYAVAEAPVLEDTGSLEMLRQQLHDHYRENPLSSQVEALHEHERVLHDQGRVVIKKTPGNGTGIKIILKLSRSPAAGADSKRSRRVREAVSNGSKDEPVRSLNGRGVKLEKQTRGSLPSKLGSGVGVQVPRRRGRPPKYLTQGLKLAANMPVLPVKRERHGLRATSVPKVAKAPVGRPRTKAVTKKVVEPVLQAPIVEEEDTQLYCFCKQRSFGDMIACDNENCTNGEWFHYKCVGLLNRVEALRYTTEKWYCSEFCRAAVKYKPAPKKRGRKKKSRR